LTKSSVLFLMVVRFKDEKTKKMMSIPKNGR
jgi:hypothetical protein